MSLNDYNQTAHLYDLDPRSIVNDDLSFYLKYAEQYRNKILEAACGTGRVSIPLARAGYDVDAYDLSKDMIDVFKKKLAIEDQAVQKRINLFVADMTKYISDKKYSLIIVPFRAFQLLTSEDGPKQFLQLVHQQLDDNGVFIMNTFRPYGQLDESWVQDEKEDWNVTVPATNRKVIRTSIRKKIDIDRQIMYPEQIYYVEQPDGSFNKSIEKLAMKYYYEKQLQELLISNNFNIKEQYGYYDFRPIDNGPELIYVCTKTKVRRYI